MAQIDKPNLHFNTVLYTGNTTDDRTISGVGFQPDWNWTKNRSATQHHWVADAVRGSSKMLMPDLTNAEYNAPSQGSIASFNADGYVLQAGSSADENYNYENNNYVSWNWKANGAGSANTDGTISSTVSANTTAGFSIVSYTGNGTSGATVGHGLGVTPDMLVVKNRDNGSYSFTIYHKSTGNSGCTFFTNDTFGDYSGGGYLRNPNNSTFETYFTSNGNAINASSDKYITYCFAEKKGYSKFGSYTGNGDADGTFIYTGFKPAWLMVKRTDSTQDWRMFDNTRSSFNVVNHQLKANSSDAEGTSADFFDFVSNGAKIRQSTASVNASGGTYIYMAFAENPIVGSNNIPATAR